MRSLISSKKGQIQGLPVMVMTMIFAGIVLILGIVISQELRDTQDGTTQGSFTNETLTPGGTSISGAITSAASCGFTTWNATLIMNGSAGGTFTNETLVEGTDYVINTANGTILNLTDTAGDSVRVTGTFYWGDFACEGANETLVGLGTFGDFWEIIVLAIVITVVIGLLLIVFGGGRRQR